MAGATQRRPVGASRQLDRPDSIVVFRDEQASVSYLDATHRQLANSLSTLPASNTNTVEISEYSWFS